MLQNSSSVTLTRAISLSASQAECIENRIDAVVQLCWRQLQTVCDSSRLAETDLLGYLDVMQMTRSGRWMMDVVLAKGDEVPPLARNVVRFQGLMEIPRLGNPCVSQRTQRSATARTARSLSRALAKNSIRLPSGWDPLFLPPANLLVLNSQESAGRRNSSPA